MFRNLLLCFAMAALATSCMSTKTKEEVMLPAGLIAWTGEGGIKSEVERGILTAAAMGEILKSEAAGLSEIMMQFDSALSSKELKKIERVSWSLLHSWAERGVQSMVDEGEISEQVASSLYVRQQNFAEIMKTLRRSFVAVPFSTTRSYHVRVPGVEAPVYAGTDPKVLLNNHR